MRWPMAWWQLMFAPKRDFAAPAGADEKLTRGAYLVEGRAIAAPAIRRAAWPTRKRRCRWPTATPS